LNDEFPGVGDGMGGEDDPKGGGKNAPPSPLWEETEGEDMGSSRFISVVMLVSALVLRS
jgi:hypothetical protein